MCLCNCTYTVCIYNQNVCTCNFDLKEKQKLGLKKTLIEAHERDLNCQPI